MDLIQRFLMGLGPGAKKFVTWSRNFAIQLLMSELISAKTAAKFLDSMGGVLHLLQKERGTASLYIESAGEIFAEEIKERIAETDAAIKELKQVYRSLEKEGQLPEAVSIRQMALLTHLKGLGDLRSQIIGLSLRYTSAINAYSFRFNVPIIGNIIDLARDTVDVNLGAVSAYASFLQWKERLGIQRAIGSRGFYAHAFRNTEFCDRMIAVLAEQKTYFTTFMMLASPPQIQLVEPLNDDGDMREIERMNGLLESNAPPSELEQYSGSDWYNILTRMIDRMREIEKQLIGTLSKSGQAGEAGVAETEKQRSGGASAYKAFVKSLALFSRIQDKDLDALLAASDLRNLEKGNLLILQGEPVSRCYVLLRGWVKIFNGTESGDEAVLQMLSAGDMLLETAVLLNIASPVSAQIVEDATLLSFPAPLIRSLVERNNSFALSMLNNLSLQSLSLVHQLEQSRLKSASERVGWYLLRCYLEQDEQKGYVNLPFDKSIIASLLDMRPETFSRALKSLRSAGFEIFDNRVKMPGDHALCKYCDAHLAVGCNQPKTPDCPVQKLAI